MTTSTTSGAGNQARRSTERVRVELPVRLDKATGLTRDVSATGVYFETQVPFEPDREIEFAIDLENATGKMRMKCKGVIVRVESVGRKTGVAVKITDSRLEVIDEASK